jgi:hypothetical protein
MDHLCRQVAILGPYTTKQVPMLKSMTPMPLG